MFHAGKMGSMKELAGLAGYKSAREKGLSRFQDRRFDLK
jgi:hypothetical protein